MRRFLILSIKLAVLLIFFDVTHITIYSQFQIISHSFINDFPKDIYRTYKYDKGNAGHPQTQDKQLNNEDELIKIMKVIVESEFINCSLRIVYDKVFSKSDLITNMVKLPFIKQVCTYLSTYADKKLNSELYIKNIIG